LENKFKIPVFIHDPKAQGGIAVRRFSQFDKQDYEHISEAHRDKCYILTVLTAGNLTILCDTLNIELKSTDVFILKPLQVYSLIKKSNNADAYLFCIEPFLLPNYCIDIFQNLTTNQQYVKIPVKQKNDILDTSSLLFRAFQEDIPNKTFVIKGLLDSLISRVAAFFMSSENYTIESKNQAYTLTSDFKKKLAENLLFHKPAFFAEKLNVTTSHLNDCVKSTTGFSLTYWLQDAVVREAKRNLYYTNKNIKEIAYDLGFEDHTYFSRLFKKITKETPLSFRNKFRE